MKSVAFNCSPRKGGNTEALLKECLVSIEENGVDTELGWAWDFPRETYWRTRKG